MNLHSQYLNPFRAFLERRAEDEDQQLSAIENNMSRAVLSALGHTERIDSGRLAALVEDLPGEVAAALPAGSLGPGDERVAARADGHGGVFARFAGDRLAQSIGGELASEP